MHASSYVCGVMMTSFKYLPCHLDALRANRNHKILCGAGQEMSPLKARRTLEAMVAKRTPGFPELFLKPRLAAALDRRWMHCTGYQCCLVLGVLFVTSGARI